MRPAALLRHPPARGSRLYDVCAQLFASRREPSARALHSLLLYRPSGRIVGAVRLAVAGAAQPLPFHALRGVEPLEKLENLAGAALGEVSRFCVARRLAGELQSTPAAALGRALRSSDLHEPDLRWVRHQAELQLMQSVVAMCAAAGVTHVCTVARPALLRGLAELGIHFTAVGRPIEHPRGLRQPCYAALDALLVRLQRERLDVWEVVTDRGRLGAGA